MDGIRCTAHVTYFVAGHEDHQNGLTLALNWGIHDAMRGPFAQAWISTRPGRQKGGSFAGAASLGEEAVARERPSTDETAGHPWVYVEVSTRGGRSGAHSPRSVDEHDEIPYKGLTHRDELGDSTGDAMRGPSPTAVGFVPVQAVGRWMFAGGTPLGEGVTTRELPRIQMGQARTA